MDLAKLDFSNLKKDLKHYGLNPKDWHLLIKTESADPEVIICHKSNSSLAMTGKLSQQAKEIHIREMKLLSI